MTLASMHPGEPTSGLAPVRRRPRYSVTHEQIVDVLWIAFFVVAAAPVHLLPINSVDRYPWLVLDLLVVVYCMRDYRPFLAMAQQNKILMSWPLVAILSTAWSLSPFISAYHGVQFLMTVLGSLLFAMQIDTQRMLRIVFFTGLFCMLASLALNVVSHGAVNDPNGALTGIYHHKNELGAQMAALIFTSACLFLSAWRPALSGGTLLLAVFTLALSHSGTAMIATVITLAPLVLAFSLRRGRDVFSLVLGLGFLVAAVVLLTFAVSGTDPFSLVLEGFGKDRTLTGRTILWQFGLDAFYNHPWLGHGFKAYWESEQTTVMFLRYVVGQKLWFFHNTFIEIAVAFGFMGPILLLAGIVTGFVVTLRAVFAAPTYAGVWRFLIVLYVAVTSLSEYPLFLNHSIWQFLFVAVIVATPRIVVISAADRYLPHEMEGVT